MVTSGADDLAAGGRRHPDRLDPAWAAEVYRASLRVMPHGFCLIERTSADPQAPGDYRYVWLNDAFTANSGVEDPIGSTVREVVPGAEADEWCGIYDKVWRTGLPAQFTKTLASRGRVQDLTAYAVDPRDEAIASAERSGRAFPAYIAVMFTDITTKAVADELRERQSAQAASIALTLQNAILGPTDDLPDGVAVRYRPATRTIDAATPEDPTRPATILQVGGDFHDVVPLGDDRCGLLVGDVVGKGLPAAAIMGQLRSAARALLLEQSSPARVLAALDTFAERLTGALSTTVFCIVVHTKTGHIDYASAGHLPALHTTTDTTTNRTTVHTLDQALGPPLAAVPGHTRTQASGLLPPGSTLVLYTDGLVETRNTPITDGIANAGATLTRYHHLPPDAIADQLLATLTPAAPADDIALIVYRHRT